MMLSLYVDAGSGHHLYGLSPSWMRSRRFSSGGDRLAHTNYDPLASRAICSANLSRPALSVPDVYIRAALQQHAHALDVAARRRDHERSIPARRCSANKTAEGLCFYGGKCVPILVLVIDGCTVLQQRLKNLWREN